MIKNLVYWFCTNPRIMKYISTNFRFQVQFKFSTGSNLYHFQAWAVPSAFKLTTAKVKFNFISSLCCQDPVLQPCTVSSQNIVIYDSMQEKVNLHHFFLINKLVTLTGSFGCLVPSMLDKGERDSCLTPCLVFMLHSLAPNSQCKNQAKWDSAENWCFDLGSEKELLKCFSSRSMNW